MDAVAVPVRIYDAATKYLRDLSVVHMKESRLLAGLDVESVGGEMPHKGSALRRCEPDKLLLQELPSEAPPLIDRVGMGSQFRVVELGGLTVEIAESLDLISLLPVRRHLLLSPPFSGSRAETYEGSTFVNSVQEGGVLGDGLMEGDEVAMLSAGETKESV
jgi:hypothetical protein